MTAVDIAKRVALNDGRDLTPERYRKLEALCTRSKVPITDVYDLLPSKYQEQMHRVAGDV